MESGLKTIACIKCGHIRNLPDAEPDWCCPKCKVVYAKVEPQSAHLRPTAPKQERHIYNPGWFDSLIHPVISIVAIVGAAALVSLVALYFTHKSAAQAAKEAQVDAHFNEIAAKKNAQSAFDWDTSRLLKKAQRWEGLVERVEGTPRFAVATLYPEIDEEIAATDALDVSPCLTQAKDDLVASMKARKLQIQEFVGGSNFPPDEGADRDEKSFMAGMSKCKPAE